MRVSSFYLGVCLSSLAGLRLTYETSPVYERPLQSAAGGFLIVGLLLFAINAFTPSLISWPERSSHSRRRGSVALDSITDPYGLRRDQPNQNEDSSQPLSARISRLLTLIIAAALVARVEIFRRTSNDGQCTVPGAEGLVLPFTLALWNLASMTRKSSSSVSKGQSSRFGTWILHRIETIREFWPSIGMFLLYVAAATIASSPKSTIICPSALLRVVVNLQSLGAAVDSVILISAGALIRRIAPHDRGAKSAAVVYLSTAITLASISLFIIGFIVVQKKPEYKFWVHSIDAHYFESLILQSLIVVVLLVASIRIAKDPSGPQDLAITIYATCSYFGVTTTLLRGRAAFPPTSPSLTLLILILGSIVTLAYTSRSSKRAHMSYDDPTPRGRSRSFILQAILIILLLSIPGYLAETTSNKVNVHPIEWLMQKANREHSTWLAQVSKSTSLGQAVDEYQRRYKQRPPPGFDKWYAYAKAKSSVIIDDFDSVHKDLLPFWGLKPREIRVRTRQVLSDKKNEVAEIQVRDGKAFIATSIWPTHLWMLEGIVAQMEKFAEHLPDMDLAFNVNDESRVVVPHNVMQQHLKEASLHSGINPIKKSTYSVDRAESWLKENITEPTHLDFIGLAIQQNYHPYTIVSCPPSSRARTQNIWSKFSSCTTCARPHSQGPFISNWPLSSSPCHQPDMAHLHGLYLSPASLGVTQTLLPIFSQSKPSGFSDILYPSPWNYMDKATYAPTSPVADTDPRFPSKKNTLFWRGATSEGVAVYGAWKGMARQRFVHLVNNRTDSLPVLLPVAHPRSDKASSARFAYDYLSPSPRTALTDLPALHPTFRDTNLTLDVSLVQIVRCGGPDCDEQEREFGLASPSDFQSHWQYKYLLDLDGAGFSGRFLPFLQSRSLPFKAGIFREWWEGRITAWRHFVPVDVRGVGLIDALGYFGAGWGGGDKVATGGGGGDKERGVSKVTGSKGEREAERMAEEGRDWAGKVLRKEDMEIYFFRVLLEWARLTDDARDEMGFEV
ncbi:hypothetical protein MMC25_007453 [Agyrium rufum]|nr:hypothetical protein [Agyrium rufum]